jgi:hypothetical protein
MKSYGEVEVTSAIDGDECSVSRSGHFTPGKEHPVQTG